MKIVRQVEVNICDVENCNNDSHDNCYFCEKNICTDHSSIIDIEDYLCKLFEYGIEQYYENGFSIDIYEKILLELSHECPNYVSQETFICDPCFKKHMSKMENKINLIVNKILVHHEKYNSTLINCIDGISKLIVTSLNKSQIGE